MSTLAAASKGHRVSQDMDAPFGLHLDGQLVAEFTTQEESDAHLSQLVDVLRNSPPVELTGRFLATDQVSFELAQHSRTVRLWKSTVTRRPYSAPAYEVVKYHVTDYDAANCIFMTDFESASTFFEFASATSSGRG